jgi:hypothetical protein
LVVLVFFPPFLPLGALFLAAIVILQFGWI